MKWLQSKGLGSNHKQAEPLTVQEEELWGKKQFWGTTALSHYWIQSFSWMASTLPYGVVMNTDNYATTTARFTWLTKMKGTNLSTQKTFQRTTREVLKDEKSSPKLLCTTLLLRTHTDALSASSRSRILSPIQLTWRCILSCTTTLKNPKENCYMYWEKQTCWSSFLEELSLQVSCLASQHVAHIHKVVQCLHW